MTAGPDIIIYPGQSNTSGEGMGSFTDSDPSHDQSIFMVGRAPGEDMTIVPARNPLAFWNYSNPLHNYGMTFARLYAATLLQPGRSVLLCPVAKGGTSILEWLGLIPSTKPLYADMAARIGLGLSLSGARIVVWVENHGETDALIASDPIDPNHALMPAAAAYQACKLDYIDKVRADFGVFPMVFGMFSPEWVGNPASIRGKFETAIQTVCTLRPMCAWTDTTGMESNRDVDPTQAPNHFSAAAQEVMAARHFATYSALLAQIGLAGLGVSPGGLEITAPTFLTTEDGRELLLSGGS
ncbi:MAG TPA: sialate O-acetylesterase [Rhizomicrobium sp.]